MLLMRRARLQRQRGQALLIVLAFVAAFLLIIWAALSLESGALLGQNSVRADTRETYALDAGVAWAMEAIDEKHGNGCNAPGTTTLTLTYPSGNVSVNVAITKGNPCHGAGASFNLTVTATGTSRRLNALMSEGNNNGMSIVWEAFQ
jgi:type II secretory pathway component PulK